MHLGVHLSFPLSLSRKKVLEVLRLPFEPENSLTLLFLLSFGQLFQTFLFLRLSFVVTFSFASFSCVSLSSVCFSSTSFFFSFGASFRMVLSSFALTFVGVSLVSFSSVKALLPHLVPHVVLCPVIGAKHGGQELGRLRVVLFDLPLPIPLSLALTFGTTTTSTATTTTTTVAVPLSLSSCLLKGHKALLAQRVGKGFLLILVGVGVGVGVAVYPLELRHRVQVLERSVRHSLKCQLIEEVNERVEGVYPRHPLGSSPYFVHGFWRNTG